MTPTCLGHNVNDPHALHVQDMFTDYAPPSKYAQYIQSNIVSMPDVSVALHYCLINQLKHSALAVATVSAPGI